MGALQPIGRVSYGPVDLNGPDTRTLRLSVRPVETPDGKSTAYNVFSITIRKYLAGSPTSPRVLFARQNLLKQGLPFIYEGQGFGDLSINTGRATDVVFGPRPKELSFKPLGGGRACELIWTVEVAIPDCADATYRFAALALSVDLKYELDKGFTTRTAEIELKIPNNRVGLTKRLSDSPDRYRESLVPPLLPGFERAFGPWVIDKTRTSLRGEIIDREMGRNIPPVGVVEVKASHKVASNVKGLSLWVGTITADYKLAKTTFDVMVPGRHFFQVLCKDRINATARAVGKNAGAIVPLALEIQEPGIYDREPNARFAFSYSFVRELKENILSASGLWRSVPDSNWKLWALSLSGSAFHPRGQAKLGHGPGDDAIIDLCGAVQDVDLRAGSGPAPISLPYGPRPIGSAPRPSPGVAELVNDLAPLPTPQNSYLYYENNLFVELDNGAVAALTLPERPLTFKDDILGGIADFIGSPLDAIKGFINAMPAVLTKPIGLGGPKLVAEFGESVHRRTRPVVALFMRGRASRYGFRPEIPRLIQIAGMRPVPANRLDHGEGYGIGIKYNAGNQPIINARWNLRYLLPQEPTGPLPLPPNPILGQVK